MGIVGKNSDYYIVRYKTKDWSGCGNENWDNADYAHIPSDYPEEDIEEYIEDLYVDYGLRSLEGYRGVRYERLTEEATKEYEYKIFREHMSMFEEEWLSSSLEFRTRLLLEKGIVIYAENTKTIS